MTADPSKFHAIAIGNKDQQFNHFEINSDFKIKIDNFVTLL